VEGRTPDYGEDSPASCDETEAGGTTEASCPSAHARPRRSRGAAQADQGDRRDDQALTQESGRRSARRVSQALRGAAGADTDRTSPLVRPADDEGPLPVAGPRSAARVRHPVVARTHLGVARGS